MDFAFILKKLLSATIMPLSITVCILLIGLIFLDNNKIKKAKIFITIGLISLIIISYQPFSNTLLSPLETNYSKLKVIPQDVSHIVLLGGDFENRGWEVLRLYHKIPNAKIITSGYKSEQKVPEAIRAAQLLESIGIAKENIIIHSKPKDTKEEVLEIKKLLDKQAFILVTSAYHMTRAMALFQKEGLNPIPAPTDMKILENNFISVPKGRNIKHTEIAIHEYLGLIWSKIKGQI